MAFVRLMKEDGTVLQDGLHDLVVFKVTDDGEENTCTRSASLANGVVVIPSTSLPDPTADLLVLSNIGISQTKGRSLREKKKPAQNL